MAQKDAFAKDINFPKVLFLHVNRVLMCIGQDDLYLAAVEGLEDVLSPYFDKEYYKALDGYRKGLDSMTHLDPMLGGKKQMIAKEENKVTRIKFRALMSLAERKNLLIERTDREEVWSLDENDTEIDTDMEIQD